MFIYNNTKHKTAMCGIWALFSVIKIQEFGKYYDAFMKIKARGPEYSSYDLVHPNVFIGFHRLAILDITAEGNQPFHYVREDGSCIYCMCNGEIYDYQKLKEEYNIKTKSHSDCEVIIPLYEKFGVEKTIKLLGSEFAFILVDISKDGKVKLIAGRDPIGVRPLFYAMDKDGSICLSSEMKGLSDIYDNVKVFPPGHYMEYENGNMTLTSYYSYDYKQITPVPPMEEIYAEIRRRFINCVRKRLVTDRPFGALLSGGLDSSLVCGVMIHLIETEFPHLKDREIEFFTIGLDTGSTDVPYAIEAVEFFRQKHPKIKHHIVEISKDVPLNAIPDTIKCIESFDITSNRASVLQWLLGKYIPANTTVKVILMGDGSDECNCSYRYELYAPTVDDAKADAIRLVNEMHRYDGKRADRCMAAHGLEVRLPFCDPEYIDYILSLPSYLVAPQNGIEKYTLRKAFSNLNIIPESIIRRTKDAMSDAVSGIEKSWYQIIQEHMETLVSDEEFNTQKDKFKHCPPFTKESYYYRKKFVEYFGDNEEKSKIIEHFWMPKWTKNDETLDPSARVLKIYSDKSEFI